MSRTKITAAFVLLGLGSRPVASLLQSEERRRPLDGACSGKGRQFVSGSNGSDCERSAGF